MNNRKSAFITNIAVSCDIYKKLNKVLFNNSINAVISVKKKYSIDMCFNDQVILVENGVVTYNIYLKESDVVNGCKHIALCILSQMIYIYASINNIKISSGGGYYKNKNLKHLCDQFGVITRYNSRYGHSPVKLSNKILDLLSEFKFDKSKSYQKKYTSYGCPVSIKHQCPICGNSVRSTKVLSVICGDCEVEMVMQE